MRKNISKILAGILCAATLMTSASPVMAYTAHWRFDFQKGDKHYCGPIVKDDNEQIAYVRMRRSDQDNPYFEERNSKLQVRVRDNYAREATDVLDFDTYTGTDARKTGYNVRYGNSGELYRLYGNVHSDSGTQWIRVSGYWTP